MAGGAGQQRSMNDYSNALGQLNAYQSQRDYNALLNQYAGHRSQLVSAGPICEVTSVSSVAIEQDYRVRRARLEAEAAKQIDERAAQLKEQQLKAAKTPQKETTMSDDKDVIPDISLTRVFKWAVVLIVAMFLGKRVWDMFGDKVTAQLHKALGDKSEAK